MQANAQNGIPQIKFSNSSEDDKEESLVRNNMHNKHFIFIQIEENSNEANDADDDKCDDVEELHL